MTYDNIFLNFIHANIYLHVFWIFSCEKQKSFEVGLLRLDCSQKLAFNKCNTKNVFGRII